MGWLPWPILPKKRWPAVQFKAKRGITSEEHARIIAGENNPELRDYYQCLWHLGGSQTDIAQLSSEDVDLEARTISYARRKTGSRAFQHFGDAVAQIIAGRPAKGLLFPHVAPWKESDRAKAFMRRCQRVGVSGVSLHSYRYASAQRYAGVVVARVGAGKTDWKSTPIRQPAQHINQFLQASPPVNVRRHFPARVQRQEGNRPLTRNPSVKDRCSVLATRRDLYC
jgi:hypothetical protein